jgi:hypothetical protein
MPNAARSAGISVFFSHPPLAKPLKLSPGSTERSMPAVSKPNVPISGPAAFFCVAGVCAVCATPAPAMAMLARVVVRRTLRRMDVPYADGVRARRPRARCMRLKAATTAVNRR